MDKLIKKQKKIEQKIKKKLIDRMELSEKIVDLKRRKFRYSTKMSRYVKKYNELIRRKNRLNKRINELNLKKQELADQIEKKSLDKDDSQGL